MKLYEQPIHTLHDLRLKKEITTKEIAESVLARIDEVEEQVHAYLHLIGKNVLENATEADDKLASGKELGWLEGMPVAVKDIFCTRGIKTTCASRMLENFIPPYESTVTQKLLAAGYNLTGKTNMDEFAMGSSTENSAFGVSRNPWNTDFVPGGSSGGSAVAVAAGEALAAIGTDTGGSIRQPASFTGIVGLKPTYGRVSRYGMVAFASSLDQGGPMTRDVEDAARLLEVISGHDEKDATSLKVETPRFSEFLNRSVKGMKIGVIDGLDTDQWDATIKRNFEENLALFESGGAEIVPVKLPNLEHAVATYYIIAPSEASSNLGRYDGIRYGVRAKMPKDLLSLYKESREQGFGQEVKLRILLGTFALSAGYYDAYYLKAQKIQNLIRYQFHEAFKSVDAIATPVSPVPPFRIGEKIDDPLQMYLIDAFTIPANLAGIPGISVPSGFNEAKMPLGLQLLANHLDEGKLIQAAHWFEREKKFERPTLAV